VATAEDDVLLSTASRLLLHTQLQLEAEGYSRDLVSAGIKRARKTAEFRAKPIRADIYDTAYLDILAHELHGVKEWVTKELEGNT